MVNSSAGVTSIQLYPRSSTAFFLSIFSPQRGSVCAVARNEDMKSLVRIVIVALGGKGSSVRGAWPMGQRTISLALNSIFALHWR